MNQKTHNLRALSPILIVEDNAVDLEAAKRAFKKSGIANSINHAESAEEALEYLVNPENASPCMILLDLNLPGIGGRKALEIIRKEHAFTKVPIIVLTTSDFDADVEMCYSLGASSYIKKPVDFQDLCKAINNLAEYWLGTALLPPLREERDRIRELEIARQTAEQANKAKSEFLAVMSHELRTPLNSILGMLDIVLDESNLDPAQQEMLAVVQKSSRNLLVTVNDILDISKIEAGCLELERIPFCFVETFNSLVVSMRPLASEKGLILESRSPDCNRYLVGDPARLLRIMLNLVGNAIKYTPEGSVALKASVQARDGSNDNGDVMLEFSVTDTGIGIAEDKLQYVFEKYAQEDSSVTRRFGGTGLGLNITKELVGQMGGEIGVDSRIGEGSCFWFRIPFPTTDEEPRDEETRFLPEMSADLLGIERKHAGALNVLVAEDDAMNQAFMKSLLPRLGIQYFDFAENGQEAVEAVRSVEYDLIMMDCHMPVLSGYEATKKIRSAEARAQKHAVPIIAMTADAMEEARTSCEEAGMDDYITKPVDRVALRNLLRRWVIFDDAK